MTRIPLEDEFNDVISKAQRGLSLSDEELATQSEVPVLDLVRAKEGAFDRWKITTGDVLEVRE